MLHLETIEPDTLELLRSIQKSPVFADTRLAGDTALALQLGHRKSIDLDFFGHLPLSGNELTHLLTTFGETTQAGQSRLTSTFFINQIKVDFVDYPYPWLDDALETDGLRLASIRDIAAMKLSAITNRGTRKDFVDLAFLLERHPLSRLIAAYCEKYPNAPQFLLLKSLSYFEDAEETPMPHMLIPRDWEWVRTQVIQAIAEMQDSPL